MGRGSSAQVGTALSYLFTPGLARSTFPTSPAALSTTAAASPAALSTTAATAAAIAVSIMAPTAVLAPVVVALLDFYGEGDRLGRRVIHVQQAQGSRLWSVH